MGRPLLSKYQPAVEMYENGMSIEQCANKFGVTRQMMWDTLGRRGVKFRHSEPNPFIMFGGKKYSLAKDGYYRLTTVRRESRMLHRDVWEFANGHIPDGCDIHHKHGNADKETTDPSRLECLTPSDHTKKHAETRCVAPDPKNCENCQSPMNPHRHKRLKESPSAFAKRRFCCKACAYSYLKGKPHGR